VHFLLEVLAIMSSMLLLIDELIKCGLQRFKKGSV
jgi:hypothetical protein